MNKATTVWGISEQLETIRINDPDFKASPFFRMCLDVLISGPELLQNTTELRRRVYDIAVRDYNSKKEEKETIRIAALEEVTRKIEVTRKEVNKAIEEKERKETLQNHVNMCMGQTLEPRRWASRLPEHDPHGDYADSWIEAANRVSELAGVTVTPSECYAYVKTNIGVDTA